MVNNRALFLVMLLGVLSVGSSVAAEQAPASAGRVEVVLAYEHRKNVNEIKQDFAEVGLANVHVQFMKAGHPPTNIGVGPQVTAERARAAIRLAKRYNRGITILLPERLFPDQYVTIASSSFDDTVEYSVGEEALKELENPALTTEQFHELYRRLTPADRPPMKKGRVF
ncbi:MAG: hypothetical protein Q8N04_02580 [Nitrospira sp.]|nr:hypothetical protein [Nitrospira sp.]